MPFLKIGNPSSERNNGLQSRTADSAEAGGRETAAGLHGIQHRPLRKKLSAFEQDRSDQDQGRNEGRRALTGPAKGKGSEAARYFCNVIGTWYDSQCGRVW